MSELDVLWESALVGYLSQVGGRDLAFRYAANYLQTDGARPISLSLPLQSEPFNGTTWFANLLPEGEMRGQAARALGVSERNEFALLERVGGDCAGALRLVPEGSDASATGEPVPLPWDELEARIAVIPRPSLLALMIQDGNLRLSLAGAQDKLPVHYALGKLALPSGTTPSTHLLKVGSPSFPDLVQNELFCLTLAREVGLPAPHAELAPTRTPILLVERFDRQLQADGTIMRLHQEDFCQALGRPPEAKYESEGGPSLAELFTVLARGSSTPLPDKRDLLRWVFFNFLIGNADAHAKNVAFLWGRQGGSPGPQLAPFYDLVCTAAYEALATKQAQKIGGEYRPRYVAGRHWGRFAEAIEVKPRYLREVGFELAEQVEAKAEAVAGGQPTLVKVTRVIGKRLDWLRSGS